jgi:hypothetical protein
MDLSLRLTPSRVATKKHKSSKTSLVACKRRLKTHKQKIKQPYLSSKSSRKVNAVNACIVDRNVYPSIVRELMGVEAAIAMRAIVTHTTTDNSKRARQGDEFCVTAMWLASLLHYGIDDCASMLREFCRIGFIACVYRPPQSIQQAPQNSANVFDAGHCCVYQLCAAVCLADAESVGAPTETCPQGSLPSGKAAAVSSAKELGVFVAGKRALRFIDGVVYTFKRRGLVSLA